MELINAYGDDECDVCVKSGGLCLNCADIANGTKGPGMVNGMRVLLPASTNPNVFRSMVYWMNHHPTELVAIRLVPYTQPLIPVFDLNIVSLGLLGRSFIGSLGPDTNKETVYIPVQLRHANDPPFDLTTNQIVPPVKSYYIPKSTNTTE